MRFTHRGGLNCLTAAANAKRDVSSRRFNAQQVLLTCHELKPFTYNFTISGSIHNQ